MSTVGAQPGSLESAAALTAEILVATLSIDRGDEADAWAVTLEESGRSNELDARSLIYALSRSTEKHLVTMRLPGPVADLDGSQLIVRQGEREYRLTPASVADVLTDLDGLARARLGDLDDKTRGDALAFLVEAPAAHGLADEEFPSARLLAVRNALRRHLPRARIAKDAPCGVNLEEVLRIDERTFWLRGWVRDASPKNVRLTVISPEGCEGEVDQEAIDLRPRKDLNKLFESHDPDEPPLNRGFTGVVELARPSYGSRGWILELESPSGEEVESMNRATLADDPQRLLSSVLWPLAEARDLDEVEEETILTQVQRPISRLRRRLSAEAQVEEIVETGGVLESPAVSVVIPLHRRTDLIEHQFAQFAEDPDLQGAELTYVVDRSLAGKLVETLDQLDELYGLPARVAVISETSHIGESAVANAGASVARGDRLLLLGGDVFPARSGWLGAMRAVIDGDPHIGAVGAKLLHEDDSIQHAGITMSSGDQDCTKLVFPFRACTVAWRRQTKRAASMPLPAAAS